MNGSELCKVCGGRNGFTSSESRRHEATKRHTDFVAEQQAQMEAEIFASLWDNQPTVPTTDEATVARIVEIREIAKIAVKDGFISILSGKATSSEVLAGTAVAAALAPGKQAVEPVEDELSPVYIDSERITPSFAVPSVADLKAIRMRQKWTAQRADRKAAKAADLGQFAGDLLGIAENEWEKERAAYAAYRVALLAAKA